ncbi:MAG: VWA domain-containing protein, partial [Candidatus Puniceispirillaceae bacterium]
MNGPDHGPDRASSQSGLRLVDNIIQFVRLLRKAGLKVGPASAANAVDAVQLIDIGERSQLYHALAACLIKRPEDRDLFDQAFEIFWQNPQWLQRVRGMLLPEIEMPKEADDDEDPVLRRLQEALS